MKTLLKDTDNHMAKLTDMEEHAALFLIKKQLEAAKALLEGVRASGFGSNAFVELFDRQLTFLAMDPVVENPIMPTSLRRERLKSLLSFATGSSYWKNLARDSFAQAEFAADDINTARLDAISTRIVDLFKRSTSQNFTEAVCSFLSGPACCCQLH